MLTEIGADQVPCLLVYNKIDLLPDRQPMLERNEAGKPVRIWLSAITGTGIDMLLSAISELLGEDVVQRTLQLLPGHGRLRAKLYSKGAVRQESTDDSGAVSMTISLPRHDFERLLQDEGITPDDLGLSA